MSQPIHTKLHIGAEEGRLDGAFLSTELSGYSGTGYVTGFGKNGDSIEIDACIPQDGHYELSIRYAALKGTKPNNLYVDGYAYGHLHFTASDAFENLAACTIFLKEGTHTIKLEHYYGLVEVDAFILTAVETVPRPKPSFELTNPNASAEAAALMKFFSDIYGSKIITGQHTSAAAGPEIDYIHEVTGKYPAMRGFDLLSYSHATTTKNRSQSAIDEVADNRGTIEQIIKWAQGGGLVEICWHWFSPLAGTDKSFYTKDTDFDLNKALIPGTPEHEAILKDMDAIALELTRLRDHNIPVLWRPLHEAEGKWFWWGAQGAEPFIKLFRWMYDLYTNKYELNNLIWLWNAPHPEWIPGMDVIDLAGADLYVQGGNYGPLTCGFEYMHRLTEGKRAIALTENGPVPDPDLMFATQAPWLWFMPWWGGFCTDPAITSHEQLRHTYNHPHTITLDDLKTYFPGSK
ncbi:glycosyl hydrolase [Paenibacillus solisilvae]|uniref:Glycosyl hydrolase n=1 Tax=Paenibacillus solisilvae TaxID=2486751 RepID=A0ABW0VV22_9BACL